MQWQSALVIYTFLHLTVWKMNPTSQSSSFPSILGKHSSSQYMGTQQAECPEVICLKENEVRDFWSPTRPRGNKGGEGERLQ